MPNDCITYQKSAYFSKLIVDYLNEKEELKAIIQSFSNIREF